LARTKKHAIVKAYLDAYRKLVISQPVLDRAVRESVVISIPLHFSGNHRVEVTVTKLSIDLFILSDMARTLGELGEGGKRITADFRKRAEEIAHYFGVSFRLDHMILESDTKKLGESIQRFAEAAKTIGDAYLLHRSYAVHARAVVQEVKQIFKSRQLPFETNKIVKGEIDNYPFDLFVAPNGRPGIAVSVIAGHNTKGIAKQWAFNCIDIRSSHGERLRTAIVLDEQDSAPWSRKSRRILRKGADIVSPSSDLSELDHQLMLQGIA
jgi:hypothetical protein